MSEPPARRGYRSELRAEQAMLTRRRILEAAGRVFSANGYQAATLADIARGAGVSTETVKKTGAKSELLIGAFELLFAGAEGTRGMGDTEAGAAIGAARDDDFVDAIAAGATIANAAAHRLWTVLLAASFSDDTVHAAFDRIQTNRHALFVETVQELKRRGLAAANCDESSAAAELSFLMSPESYQQLVTQSGWDEADYRAWIHDALLRVTSDDGQHPSPTARPDPGPGST